MLINGDSDGWVPSILEPEGATKEYRKNWGRMIQKIYEVDPLTCPKCSGKMSGLVMESYTPPAFWKFDTLIFNPTILWLLSV